MSKTLIKNIKTLYTSRQVPPVKGADMSKVYELNNAYILIEEDKIKEIGTLYTGNLIDTFIYDAKDLICIPGLIDSHTHLVFGGSREHEFSKKIAGVPYLDILKEGGGIHSTVKQTKAATSEVLYDQAKKSLDEMLLFGVTTLEAKSGYGLDLATEIKQLLTLKKLNELNPIDILITYLGAHALPPKYKDKRVEFINKVMLDLEYIKENDLAKYVDVFCEKGVFTALETEKIFKRALELGFKLRLHSDEIESIGGTGVAIKLKANTVDHLMAIKDEDITSLAKSNTIANLLPATSFFLNKEYAPARKLIDQGCAVSVSSDYNPGSTPSENYQFTLQLAGNKLRMVPYEILTAATINPAYGLDISNKVGSLEVGKQADILLLDALNLDYFIYHYGINHTRAVFKNGKLVVDNRTIIKEEI
ncbi:MAG: imidazolonepropionase [Tenericutes bacterium]|nr:imidazolonepropionase [Mycoplasmatota bacterium]